MEALGFDIGPNCWDLTPEECANGYNIYAFKMTTGPVGTLRNPAPLGAARFAIKFSIETAENISVLLRSQHCAEIQIHKYKNIIPIKY